MIKSICVVIPFIPSEQKQILRTFQLGSNWIQCTRWSQAVIQNVKLTVRQHAKCANTTGTLLTQFMLNIQQRLATEQNPN